MDVTAKNMVFNLLLFLLVGFLFLLIRWYFSRLSSNIKSRLHYSEVMVTVMVAMFTFLLISNKHIDIFYRYIYFALGVGLFSGVNLLRHLHLQFLKRNKKMFPKSYLIYHAGRFFHGPIIKNKLSQEDIVSTLDLKGVNDLNQVDSIILERDGELTVIFKAKSKRAA